MGLFKLIKESRGFAPNQRLEGKGDFAVTCKRFIKAPYNTNNKTLCTNDIERGRMEAMSVETTHDFGLALRKARKEAGLSQMRLAEMCGCSQRFVSEVERGKQTAELGRALKLLESLRVPITIGTMRAGMDGRAGCLTQKSKGQGLESLAGTLRVTS